MEWESELILEFISLYEKQPVIWNPSQTGHKEKKKMDEAWKAIERDLSAPMEVTELKRKMDSLRAGYRSLRRKMAKAEARNRYYEPKWFAFPLLDRFFGPLWKKMPTENSPNDDEEEDIDEEENSIKEQGENEDTLDHDADEDTSILPRLPEPSSAASERKRKANRQNENGLNKVPKQLPALPRISEVYCQKQANPLNDGADSCTLYCKLLADKLRGLPFRARTIVQNQIDNLVFEAQMAEMDHQSLSNTLISSVEIATPSSSATSHKISISPSYIMPDNSN